MLVLLWGVETEQLLAAVRRELKAIGAPTLELDQRDAPETTIELDVGCDPEGEIQVRDRRIDLSEITVAYIRPYELAWEDGAARRRTVVLEHAITCWSMITPGLVVNRPQAMVANDCKPCQMEQIRALGFRVPETLLTTDPEAAHDFWEDHGAMIYKSVSGTRSIVSRLKPLTPNASQTWPAARPSSRSTSPGGTIGSTWRETSSSPARWYPRRTTTGTRRGTESRSGLAASPRMWRTGAGVSRSPHGCRRRDRLAQDARWRLVLL